MQYKRLGNTGLKVSRICLGTLDFGLRLDEAASTRLLHAAMELGVNFLDTSEAYPKNDLGAGERIIGKALAGRRHQMVIATKVFQKSAKAPNASGLSRLHIMHAVEASLKRLQTDYIDVYMSHHPDPHTPMEETLRAYDDLVRQGKVLYTGCSNFTTWQLCKMVGMAEFHRLAKPVCVEPPYNLLTRDIEIELLPYCAYDGIGVCVYSPMASELLSGRHQFGAPPQEGRFTDERGYGPKSRSVYWNERNFSAVERLKEVAAGLDLSLPRFSLAWVMSNDAITSAISAPITLEHLQENVSAVGVTLPKEALDACDDVWETFRAPRHFYAEPSGPDVASRWGWDGRSSNG